MDGNARHVDRRIIWVWMAPTAIALLAIWLISSLAYLFLPADFTILSLPKPVFPIALLVALAFIAGLPLYAWTYLTYDRFTYELTPTDLVVREGVVTRKTNVIPYERIEDISSERTLIERMIGLATIQIETAGRSRGGSAVVIPGIANKEELIPEILAMVNKKKEECVSEPGKPCSEDILSDILKELKTLSSKMDTFGSKSEPRKDLGAGAGASGSFRRK